MVCGPAAKEARLNEVWPFVIPKDPSNVPSIVMATVPVGVPAPGATGLIVTVRVTACPNTDGLADEVIAVDLAAWATVCVKAPEVLVVKLVSPPYTTVIV